MTAQKTKPRKKKKRNNKKQKTKKNKPTKNKTQHFSQKQLRATKMRNPRPTRRERHNI
jgi:hypothetical protein